MYVRCDLIKELANKTLLDMNILHPPVDVRTLLGQHFKIKYSEVIEDGLIYNRPGLKKPVIFINPSKCEGRTNWTFAHELGHIKLRHLETFNIDDLSDFEHAIIEREAHIFAAELLMPYKWLKHYWKLYPQYNKVNAITKLFGVSKEALINRLIEKNILKNNEELMLYFPYYYKKLRYRVNNTTYQEYTEGFYSGTTLDDDFYEEESIELSKTN
ncbi:protein of unknown function [Bacillus sp. UNCCL81]|nr:protein of unknown function [Bacillus sp. UNCCL81]